MGFCDIAQSWHQQSCAFSFPRCIGQSSPDLPTLMLESCQSSEYRQRWSGREYRNLPGFPVLPSPWGLASCGTLWCRGRWLLHNSNFYFFYFLGCKDNANESNESCFQIAECSLSSAKIRIFYQRTYTLFSEDITIIGDLFLSAIFHFYAFFIILLAFAS